MGAVFVSENEVISEIFKDLQEKMTHIAIVLDEFGGTAGIATLEILGEDGAYEKLENNSKKLCEGILEKFNNAGLNYTGTRVASMFSVFFTEQNVTDFASASTSDTEKFSKSITSSSYIP